MSSVQPIFIPLRDVPDISDRTAEYTICSAATRSSGVGTICGVQKLNQIWRLYPKTNEARVTLLSKGIEINGISVRAYNQHPHIGRGSNGTELPSTKLTIRDVPISYSDQSIESALVSKGVILRSKIGKERVRDPEGKLTDWLTGARFVWIETPQYPLSRFMTMGPFRASLFHREMKETCNRCLEKGHQARECKNEEVCHACHIPGHRKQDCPTMQTYSSRVSRNTVHDTRSQDRESITLESDDGLDINDSTEEEDVSDSEGDIGGNDTYTEIDHRGESETQGTKPDETQKEKESEGEEDQDRSAQKERKDQETENKQIEEVHKTFEESGDEPQGEKRPELKEKLPGETKTEEKVTEKEQRQTRESGRQREMGKLDGHENRKSMRGKNKKDTHNQDSKITKFMQRERSASLKRKQSESHLNTALPATKKSSK